ncbi:coiled-coil domain-containing protein 34-like [Erpetoichthys calabaricus]|uniref:coiled-coil domain-containing protein 34-like n=1 Tax=Erpetoichthys calabaricus TaxID=27687 RepID=UPI002234C265|nr:coiled-coil domain-containing protein 34-like [Erpetoichthys calabaricus]
MSGTPTERINSCEMSHTPTQLTNLRSRRSTSTPCRKSSSYDDLRQRTCDLGSTGDSTESLLSPIYHDSFEESDTGDDVSAKCDKKVKRGDTSRVNNYLEEERQISSEFKLTAWEQWIVQKAQKERIEMQLDTLKAMTLKQEQIKEAEENEKKKILTAEKREEWLQRKNQQEKLERERQRTKMLEEISAKEIEKRRCDERAREKYHLWLEKKKEEEIDKKQRDKEEAAKREAELKERREMADKKFKEWLRSAKDKPRPASSPCGYSNGKPTGFYDQNYYPAPSFYNPIPWKPIHVPKPEESSRKQAIKKTQKQRSYALQRHAAAVSCKPKDNLGIGLVRQVRR